MWVESSARVFISICLKIQKYCHLLVFQSISSQTQNPTLQTWCMRQVVYLENFMGKSTIVQKWWKKLSEFVKLYFKLDSHICTIFLQSVTFPYTSLYIVFTSCPMHTTCMQSQILSLGSLCFVRQCYAHVHSWYMYKSVYILLQNLKSVLWISVCLQSPAKEQRQTHQYRPWFTSQAMS